MIQKKTIVFAVLIVLLAVGIAAATRYDDIRKTSGEEISEEKLAEYNSLLSQLNENINSENSTGTTQAIAELKKAIPDLPLSLLLREIENKENSLSYRWLLSDLISHKIMHGDTDNESLIHNFDVFEQIIKDKDDEPMIRRAAISSATEVYSFTKDNQIKNRLIETLKNIINDPAEDPKVVGQAINSISQIEYTGIDGDLLTTLKNWRTEEPVLVRTASKSLGKSKNMSAIPVLIEIIDYGNEDLFYTAVYSLGLTGSPQMIEPFINNYDKFGEAGRAICRGALRNNKQLLLQIISEKKSPFLVPAIIALGKIKEKSTIPPLQNLLEKSPEHKTLILQTIQEIEKKGL